MHPLKEGKHGTAAALFPPQFRNGEPIDTDRRDGDTRTVGQGDRAALIKVNKDRYMHAHFVPLTPDIDCNLQCDLRHDIAILTNPTTVAVAVFLFRSSKPIIDPPACATYLYLEKALKTKMLRGRDEHSYVSFFSFP